MSVSPTTVESSEYASEPSSTIETIERIPLSKGGESSLLGESAPNDPALENMPDIPVELLDPHGALNKPNVLPGYNGIPFRGEEIPQIKETDPVKPEVALDGQAAVFDLSKPEHLKYYKNIFHMAYNGRAQIGIDRVDFDANTGKYTAFVRWALIYTHMPKGQRR